MRVRFPDADYFNQKRDVGNESFQMHIHKRTIDIATRIQKELNPQQDQKVPTATSFFSRDLGVDASNNPRGSLSMANAEFKSVDEKDKLAVYLIITPSADWIKDQMDLITNSGTSFQPFGGWTSLAKPPVIKIRLMDFDMKQELPAVDMVK